VISRQGEPSNQPMCQTVNNARDGGGKVVMYNKYYCQGLRAPRICRVPLQGTFAGHSTHFQQFLKGLGHVKMAVTEWILSPLSVLYYRLFFNSGPFLLYMDLQLTQTLANVQAFRYQTSRCVNQEFGGIVFAAICWAASAQRRCYPTGRCTSDFQSLVVCQYTPLSPPPPPLTSLPYSLSYFLKTSVRQSTLNLSLLDCR
jgi:hypothetical protein